jgi:general secretion pathway protein A
MYKNFFGLQANPFNVNPDPRYLYLTPQTQEILSQLTYGIQNRKGLILLTGEVGTGKTTLINYLLDWLHQQKMPTAFIFNCHLSVTHLFDFILNDFGIKSELRLKDNMLLQLNQWLEERFRRGLTTVLIMDEVQGASIELLEEVRLLLNLETASEKLLQIVLVGQPEIEEKLNRPEMRQLRQRIALRCRTEPLTLAESYGYIAGRLSVAGAAGDPVFSSEAIEAAHFYSRGIPRVMNLLCEHALINAYVEQINPVAAAMVEEAAKDFLMDEFHAKPAWSARSNHSDGRPGELHSVVAMDRARPRTSEDMQSQKLQGAEWIGAAAAVAVEEPPSIAENGLPMVNPRQPELSLDSIALPPDSVAELVGAMRRMWEKTPVMPTPYLVPANHESNLLKQARRRELFSAEDQALALEKMNAIAGKSRPEKVRDRFVSLAAWGSSLRAMRMPVFLRAEWPRMRGSVVRWTRQPFYSHPVLQRWKIEFKHDWNELMNTVGLRQTKSWLLRWLRQPPSSKSMAEGKE